MVCLGNICRSPLAEGILRSKLKKNTIIDSAGTGSWHAGENPDQRSIKVAKNHGINISQLKARQIKPTDFDDFDLIFVMDESNYNDVIKLTTSFEQQSKIKKILRDSDVPDPYWGSDEDFENVFQLLDIAIDKIIVQHNLL